MLFDSGDVTLHLVFYCAKKGFHILPSTFCHKFNTAIIQISHESRHLESTCNMTRGISKAHSLNRSRKESM